MCMFILWGVASKTISLVRCGKGLRALMSFVVKKCPSGGLSENPCDYTYIGAIIRNMFSLVLLLTYQVQNLQVNYNQTEQL